jgi:hypothetical protein
MSLVFLKSKDKQASEEIGRHNPNKPYRFSNYLTQPLRIPPNSQVAYVSSSFNIRTVLDNDPSYMLTSGDDLAIYTTPQLLISPDSSPQLTGAIEDIINAYVMSANEFSMDSDYIGLKYEVANINGIDQSYPNSGIQLLYNPNDNKVTLKTIVHIPVDQYNLYFNACRSNGIYSSGNWSIGGAGVSGATVPAGINWTDKADPKFHNDIRILGSGSPSGNISFSVDDCYGLLAGTETNIGNARNNVYLGGANWYNTGFSSTGLDGNGNLYDWLQPMATTVGTPMPFDAGRYGGHLTTTGIKKSIGNLRLNNAPQNNRGGHDTQTGVAGEETGGYAIWTVTNTDQNQANIHFDRGAIKEGFCGIAPQFVGVHSLPYIRAEGYKKAVQDNVANPKDESVQWANYLKTMDLNVSTDPDNPEGAKARYLFGLKFFDDYSGPGTGDLKVQAQILDCIAADMAQSQYIDIGPELSIGQLSNGINTATNGPAFIFAPSANYSINTYNTTPGRRSAMIFFRFRWINKTQMNIEFTLSVDGLAGSYNNAIDEPFAPANPYVVATPPDASTSDPRDKWCLLASMDTDKMGLQEQPQYYLPGLLGDINLVQYPIATGTSTADHRQCFKGWFCPRQSNRYYFTNNNGFGRQPDPYSLENIFYDEIGLEQGLWAYDPLDPTDLSSTSGALALNNLGGETQEQFTSDGILNPQVKYLGVPTQDSYVESFFDYFGDYAFITNQPNISMGYQLGFNNINSGADVKNLINISPGLDELTGADDLSAGGTAFSHHIQLANLPIISQNGVVSSVTKTIYVLDGLCIDNYHDTTSYRTFCDKAPYPLWIDLNNLETIELNKIDVFISTDENTPQLSLYGQTELVVQFRDKENGNLINSIPVKSIPVTRTF